LEVAPIAEDLGLAASSAALAATGGDGMLLEVTTEGDGMLNAANRGASDFFSTGGAAGAFDDSACSAVPLSRAWSMPSKPAAASVPILKRRVASSSSSCLTWCLP
jgi:hypothetical protein